MEWTDKLKLLDTCSESELAFAGVCLLEEGRQLQNGDLAFLMADSEVLALPMGRRQTTHGHPT